VVEISDSVLKNCFEGVTSVEQFMDQLNIINSDNQNSVEEIIELRNKTSEITKVMGIINNIADQTKLIAFNAAIEASSAGESGKRFGVVASEIRRLADGVMDSTDEIENKIVQIQQNANRLVVASETSKKGIQEGMESFALTVGLLNEILAGAQETTNAAKQISLSTQQQKNATDQVVEALKDMNKGSRQASTSIGDIGDIAASMKDLSGSLTDLITKYKVSDD